MSDLNQDPDQRVLLQNTTPSRNGENEISKSNPQAGFDSSPDPIIESFAPDDALKTVKDNMKRSSIVHQHQENIGKKPDVQIDFNDRKSVIGTAGCCSRFMFSWAFPFVKRAKKEQLSIDDFGGLRKSDQVQPKFQRLQEIYHQKPKEKRSLIWSILKAYKYEYFFTFFVSLLTACFSYISPFIVQRIIAWLQGTDSEHFGDKYYVFTLLGALVSSQLMSYILYEHMLYYQVMIGCKSTNTLIAMIFQKQLRLSQATNKKFGHGEIVNFVQVDAQQIYGLLSEMSDTIQIPIVVGYAFTMLFYILGLSFFSGIAVFVFAFVSNLGVGLILEKQQKEIMRRKDRRMNHCTEAIGNIKTLKLYSWTDVFQDEIQERRVFEFKKMKTIAIWLTFIIASLYFFPQVLSSVVFSTYIGTGHQIDLATAFTVLILFDLIKNPLRQLPLFFSSFIQVMVSIRRIQKFLDSDELDLSKMIDNTSGEYAIKIDDENFSWGVKIEEENKEDASSTPKKEEEQSILEEDKSNKTIVLDNSKLDKQEPLIKASQVDDQIPEQNLSGNISKEDLFAKQGDDTKQEDKKEVKTLDQIITLKNVKINIKKGEFVCIIGDVGSGKTSLLQTVIGDLLYVSQSQIQKYGGIDGLQKVINDQDQIKNFQKDLIEGLDEIVEKPIKVNGSISYVQQVAWIQNKTIRDNILFGLPLDKNWYVDVIRLCELERDLEILSCGDLTEIGEKGINLSGGQKARVSLARAVYSQKDIILMDDPISALDASVRKKIIMNLIMNHLKSKTRVLVTHAIDFIHLADKVILMEKGRIAAQGTYSELKENDQFQKLIEINKINQGSESAQQMKEQSAVKLQESEIQIDASGISDVNEENLAIQRLTQIQNSAIRQSELLQSQIEEDQKVELNNEQKLELFEKLGRVSSESDGKILKNENEEVIKVGVKNYLKLLKFGGGWWYMIFLQFIMIGFTSCKILTDYYIGKWANENDIQDQKDNFKKYTAFAFSFASGTGLFVAARAMTIFVMSIRASTLLHEQMIGKVMNAPINTFFDVTPVGTIMNRFSKDLQVLDTQTAFIVGGIHVMLYQTLAVLIVIAVTNWYILAVFPVLLLISYILFTYTVPSYKECNRIESITKSPLLNYLGESLSGASTIRAFQKDSDFITKNYELLNRNLLATQMSMGCWCWYGIRMDFVSITLMATATVVCVIFRDTEDPVFLAMVFQYILNVQEYLVLLLYFMGDLEKQMVSITRCFNLLEIDQEKQESKLQLPISDVDNFLDKQWPSQGQITFEDVYLRYRPKTDLVLKGLSFDIQGGHKIGIVGRTGAGKSTISMGLTRIVEIEKGSIKIDGIDIQQVPLKKLRQKLTIIPQDPTLFTGTLRFNIDPTVTVPDSDIIELLKKAGLQNILNRQDAAKEKDEKIDKKNKKGDDKPKNELDFEITENGGNLSSGEKQLICICRAILRKNKIIVLDEATANIDIKTEQSIQELISKEFNDCTVITIAHRLQTIIESDKVLVLGEGKVLEYDKPQTLLQNELSYFSHLVSEMQKKSS